jgi:hypothetical protein
VVNSFSFQIEEVSKQNRFEKFQITYYQNSWNRNLWRDTQGKPTAIEIWEDIIFTHFLIFMELYVLILLNR